MADELCEDNKQDRKELLWCYSDLSSSSSNPTIHGHHLHGFDSNPSEIFNLTTGMEMIGFSKNPLEHQHHHHQQDHDGESSGIIWKSYFTKHANHSSSSSSKAIDEPAAGDFYQQDLSSDQNLVVGLDSAPWQENTRFLVDDSSLRCVFSAEQTQNQRPSNQALSLSLCPTQNPCSIGLQSFPHSSDEDDACRYVDSCSRDGFVIKASHLQQQWQFLIRNSKYLNPTQQLLNEFCGLRQNQQISHEKNHRSLLLRNGGDDEGGSCSRRQTFFSDLGFMELQKRRTRLLSLVEEVDRRYGHYCEKMRGLVSSFEAVAGPGSATVYSTLASNAMSRHFRSLRDGIVAQIQATRREMGDKDSSFTGITRGETPRLKMIDQALRQQRAMQQMSLMESHPWRPQRGLPERSVSILRAWLFEHFLHPYPSDVDKHILARQTGLSRSQVSNWFINARVRLWKPMVEEMYLEETKDEEHMALPSSSSGCIAEPDGNGKTWCDQIQNPSSIDQKPRIDHVGTASFDSESLSSIVSNTERIGDLKGQHQGFASMGTVGLEFSSYNLQSFNGGGVSLTLGLQQQGSLLYARDQIEDSNSVQYSSLFDANGQHNLPYRNLMGAQLLHDLAG